MVPLLDIQQGNSPIILGLPHTGTHVPDDINSRLNDNGLLLADTDWHLHRLYDGLLEGATTVRTTVHRYCIDVNRDPAGASLYPGQNTTTLIPMTDFDGKPIWKAEEEPREEDIGERIARFHRPYHDALAAEVERIKALHGVAVVYDCHSIRSLIPFLFDGRLPDFNIGTDLGKTCDGCIEASVVQSTSEAQGFTSVLNGRFRGGWTTRHYGKPETGSHAIQMELAQHRYLASEAVPFNYDETRAAQTRAHLKTILERIEQIAFTLNR